MEETSAPPPTLSHAHPTNEDVVLHAHADDVVVPSLTDEEQETVVDKLEEVKDDFLPDFPPGYRFAPLDEELITHYLLRKIKDQPLPPNKIKEINIYKFNPEDLAEKFKVYGEDEKEWYFFSPRDKKYPNGSRPNRAAGDGFWKATGADKKIEKDGKEIGLRKALVFYRGKAPKGEKTNWIMHEYRTPDKKTPRMRSAGLHNMQLDKFVLCRIYEKNDRSPKAYTYGKTRSPREALELDEPLDDFPHEGLPFEGEANNILDQYGGEGHTQFTSHGSYSIPPNQFHLNQNFQSAEYNYYSNYNTFVNGGIQASYYENNPEFYLTIPHQATPLQYINRQTLLEAKQDPSLNYFLEDNDILNCFANEMTPPLLGEVASHHALPTTVTKVV